MITQNDRLNQLVYMFTYIIEISQEKALEYIMKTDTGKAVAENNQSVIYEQQTENLFSIIEELKKETNCRIGIEEITEKDIVVSLKSLQEYERDKEKEIKGKLNQSKSDVPNRAQQFQEKRKRQLKIKQQNRENERRVRNVD